jgi:hypothetical protein
MSATLLVRRGDTWRRRFLWQQDGVPLDLSLADAKFEVRRPGSGELVATGTTSIISALGVVDVYVDDTGDILPGNYVADLQLTFLDGTKQSTPPMTVIVQDDVTETVGGAGYVYG